MYPWVCGRCAREFNAQNLQELTVRHRDHDHDNNPADGSNWELLCVYCHDNEHSRGTDSGFGDLGGETKNSNLMTGIDRWVIREVFELITNDYRADPVRYRVHQLCQFCTGSCIDSMETGACTVGVSDTTLLKLIQVNILVAEQIAPYAPLEIKRADLDREPVLGILQHLKATGKLVLEGDPLAHQQSLFDETQ